VKIFVTGATGFVGGYFCRAAALEGHEVLALCRSDGGPHRWRNARGSLEDLPWDEIEAFEPEAVVHLAWVATPGVYLNSPENEKLIDLSASFFERLCRIGVEKITAVGTCIEYAPSDRPLNERNSPLGPSFPYSRAKVETMARLQKIADAAGVPWSWARVFYPYGPGEHPGRMPTSLFRKFQAGERVELKTPSSVKDYIFIDDLASGLLRVVESGLTGPVNLGSGQGIAIRDLAAEIADISGASLDLISEADPPAVDPFPVTVADASRLKSTGWEPRYSLREGLERLSSALAKS
jgi:nucleoside-diphosphate-sugar epimerase